MIKLSVPIVAPSVNKWFGRGHWSERKRIVDIWDTAIWLMCQQDKIPPITEYPICIATKTYFKSKRKRDTSNCFTANKLAEDGLVRAGILIDDTPKYVTRHIVEVPEFGHHEDCTVIMVHKEWEEA